MKKLLILALLFVSIDIYAECVCHKKVEPGDGVWDWKDNCDCCYDSGVNCIKTKCSEVVSGPITQVDGGYSLTLQLQNVNLMIKDATQQWVPFQRNGNNYPFDWADFLIIVECPEYPSLVNRQIQLDGITTDSQGYYTVFIPNN